jgi:hypothetical protein
MSDETPDSANHRAKRRRVVPLVWAAGAAAAVLLGLTVTGTISGFTASITNDTNTSGSGTLLMQESNSAGTVTCYSNGAAANSAVGAANSNTCSTINKLGGDQAPNTNGLNLAPGTTGTATIVNIKNAGTITASQFTLTPSTCTQSVNSGNTQVIANGTATDFGTKVNVKVKQAGVVVFQGTAAQLASGTGATTPLPANLGAVTAGTSVALEFDVSLDSAATNAYQGLALSLPMTWQFTQ